MRTLVLLSLAALVGCGGTPGDTADTGKTQTDPVDADGDGVTEATDCDDHDPDVSPDAAEVCDGADNDCDGLVDDADDSLDPAGADAWYPDADDDGYGDAAGLIYACAQPDATVKNGDDCDDVSAAVYPNANEVCDGVDNDCDALVDDADPDQQTTGLTTWYPDTDEDGYGDQHAGELACTAPAGSVSDGTDCDDADGAVNPAAQEICNEIDDDCDVAVDDGDDSVDLSTGTVWWIDADGDGHGDPSVTEAACEDPPYGADNDDDCDDADNTVYPGAPEICDDQDNDCDAVVDDADADIVGRPTWYVDTDGDGYGLDASAVIQCDGPTGTITTGADCDDADGAVNPGATEVCDEIDNDCDVLIDDRDDSVTGRPEWYPDADGDGFGEIVDPIADCDQIDGYVNDGTDCDDTQAAVNPGTDEICDDLDNDCDTLVDDADDSLALIFSWFEDVDGDGYGDATTEVVACDSPDGWVGDGTDCDDLDDTRSPGLPEVCDLIDNDCDGQADFGFNVPEDYATVQEAIDAAPDFGHVCVGTGTWTENLTLSGRSLTVEGYGTDETWIDGGGAGLAVSIDGGSDVVIAGLTVTNGSGALGGGIDVDTSTLLLQDVGVADNLCPPDSTVCYGAGVHAMDSALSLYDVDITGNHAELDGFAPSVNVFGLGLYLRGGSLDVSGGSIADNAVSMAAGGSATVLGVGAYVADATATFSETVISGNHSQAGGIGGGALFASATVTLSGVAIQDNVIDTTDVSADESGGGGLGFEETTATLSDCEILDNSVAASGDVVYASGGGVYAIESGLSIADGLIRGNSLSGVADVGELAGGAIYANATDVTLTDTVVDENSAYGELSGPGSMDGGALSVTGDLSAARCSFNDNSLVLTSTDDLYGSGIVQVSGNTTLEDVEVSGNQLYLESTAGSAYAAGTVALTGEDFTATSLLVEDNVATVVADSLAGAYPGVSAEATTVTVTGGSFSRNQGTAIAVGSSSAAGGGLGVSATTMTISGIQANDNVLDADIAGGAGLDLYASTLTLTQSEILGNTVTGAETTGGGVRAQTTDLTAANLIIAGNTMTATRYSGALAAGAWWTVYGTGSLTNADFVKNVADGEMSMGGAMSLSLGESTVLSVKNVNIVGNVADVGGAAMSDMEGSVVFTYSNAYDNGSVAAFFPLSDPTGADGNISADPGYTDVSSTDPLDWDLTLGAGSVCIDAGDPAVLDADGSVSDLGAFGGPGGSGW